MSREELKELLASYRYDEQYLKEKLKEIQHFNNITRSQNVPSISQFTTEFEDSHLKRILRKKNYIESLLQKLKQPYYTLLYLKYISLLTFEQIADRMNYSTKRIYQLHSEGLSILTEISKDEQNISMD